MEVMQTQIERLEQLELELSLVATREKNLEAFRNFIPSIYDKFSKYEPQRYLLGVDESGVSLVDVQNKIYAYNGRPVDVAAIQAANFLAKPRLSVANFFSEEPHDDPRYFHSNLVNSIISSTKDDMSFDVCLEKKISSMIFSGCGLGLQIERLNKTLDITHLIIYEPEEDIFYASLSTIDWSAILPRFSQGDRRLDLLIGLSPENAFNDLRVKVKAGGIFNSVFTFTLDHELVGESTEFLDIFRANHALFFYGLGFVEDEQIGIAHSAANIGDGCQLFTNLGPVVEKGTAIVVGNGPSLDALAEYLRLNKSGATIISCGTALGSLAKLGIKPDIHVEQERNFFIKSVIEKSTSPEFRAGVRLIGLNTVHPEVFELFDESYVFQKPSDAGTTFLENLLGKELVSAPFCNPTVTNFGLSAAICLGFRTVSLVGVDLGMIKSSEHHSKFSIYKGGVVSAASSAEFTVKGNLRGEVLTNRTLDDSRHNIENFLSQLVGVRVFNPNDGAHIRGCVSIRPKDLQPIEPNSEKQQVLQTIFDFCFVREEVKSDKIVRGCLDEFLVEDLSSFLSSISLPSKGVPQKSVLELLHEKYKLINDSPVLIQRLVRGAVGYYFSLMMRYTAFASGKDYDLNYQVVQEHYARFLDYTNELLTRNLFMKCRLELKGFDADKEVSQSG